MTRVATYMFQESLAHHIILFFFFKYITFLLYFPNLLNLISGSVVPAGRELNLDALIALGKNGYLKFFFTKR